MSRSTIAALATIAAVVAGLGSCDGGAGGGGSENSGGYVITPFGAPASTTSTVLSL